MKKLFVSLCMMSLLSMSVGQNFSVPEYTLEQKHDRASTLTYAVVAVGIAAAKNAGQTVEEYGNYCGEQFKTSWNKDRGFDGFVKGMLMNWESMNVANAPDIVILEQSDSKMVMKALPGYHPMFSQGPVMGVSEAEIALWFDRIGQKIAAYMGAKYAQKEAENGFVIITLSK